MNDNNLIPQNKRTESERRKIARAGGIASGKARKEKAEHKAALLAILKAAPLSPEDEEDISRRLLNATQDQLTEIAVNKDLPVYIRRRARLLMSKDDEKAVDMAERILDRAYGKPKQKTELDATLKDMQPVVVATFGLNEGTDQ